MLDKFFNNSSDRDKIVEYILNVLTEVNDQIILFHFNNLSPSEIEIKTNPDDFVSIADKKSESFIANKLIGFLNINNFIGEESSFNNKEKYNKLLNQPLIWVIDPIDGTKNYINGNNNFCSMISLVNHSIPIATFIYFPFKRELFFAFKKQGSYKINVDTKEKSKLLIDATLSSKIIGSGGTKGIPEIYKENILNNLRTSTERLFIGSAGIETILLATNKIQFIFHGRVTPWDHSPLNLITKEAGGCVYMARNKKEFNIKVNGPILAASNNNIWEKIRETAIPKDSLYRL